MSTDKQKSRSLALRCGAMVSLRFRRIGKQKLKSLDGRWTLFRSYDPEGGYPARWVIYDNNIMADAGTYTQCRATARERLEREAQANIAGHTPKEPSGSGGCV